MLNILNLFDGMSVGMVALKNLGLIPNVDFKYFSSEIDKHAIKCSEHNHPNEIIRLGDVTKITYKEGKLTSENGVFDVGKIDILMGGSPCQQFSALGNQTGLEGNSSKLFFEYLRILKEIQEENPNLIFLLENVKMRKDYKKNLDDYLGNTGVPICSSLLSFQKRHRIYWSNNPISIPTDLKVSFQDYKDVSENQAQYKMPVNKSTIAMWNNGNGRNNIAFGCANVTDTEKIYCLTTKQYRTPNSGVVAYEDWFRLLTREELEQAQTLPIGYTKPLSYNQAQAVLGNGWTASVITHILKDIMKDHLESILNDKENNQDNTN